MVCFFCVAAIAILYILFDVNYFVRIIFTIVWGRLFEKKKKLLDTTTIYGKCFLSQNKFSYFLSSKHLLGFL